MTKCQMQVLFCRFTLGKTVESVDKDMVMLLLVIVVAGFDGTGPIELLQ
jgi:hypothetical protein